MLRTLLESNARRPRHAAGAAASVLVHAVLIAGAVVATAAVDSIVPPPRQLPLWPLVLTPPARQVEQRPSEGARRPTPRRGAGQVKEAGPPVPAVPDLSLPWPGKVPVEIQPGNLLAADTALWDSRRERNWGGDIGSARPVGGEPATLATVDRPAALLVPPRPRYPDQLRAARVIGRVVVRLVVDTMGRVEPGSVVVLESSHDLFTQSVRTVLRSLRFTAAAVGGQKVRMLVDLPFEFRLNE